MCGLAGWAASRAGPDPDALPSMLEALAHRNGEEALSALIDRRPRRSVVLGASLVDRASGVALALDGAILNAAELRDQLRRHGFAFAGESADELLLRAYQYWDKEVVKQLRGAFAFALWDARKDRLMLARDRFGQKPLYLAERAGVLHFASEAKALARLPGLATEVDTAAVADYLALGYVRGPRTLLAGVRKLAPASYALWQLGVLRESRYWTAPDAEAPTPPRAAARDEVAAFIERLDEAVRAAARGAEPPAALLSRGFDSAAIVALMARQGTVHTFCAGFAEDRRSEAKAAAELARHLGTRHRELVLEARELLAHLPQLVARRDAPFCRPADAALHLIACQTARHVRIALSGDGADEILGGERRHAFLRAWAPRPRLPQRLFVLPLPRDDAHEQTHALADNVLERAERMSATAALELRLPFLDHRFAEHVSRLPDAQRVRGLATKWILRKACARLLAGAPRMPRKGGLRISLGGLMRAEMRDLVLEHLRGPGCLTRAYYDGAVLDRLIDEHLGVRRNHEEILWTLLNLEIWHRNYRTVPRPAAPARPLSARAA